MAFGDRKDGKLLRKLNPYYSFIPFIMNKRNDAMTFFEDSLEITEVDRYLRRKRQEGMKGLGMLHLFVASYVRTLCSFPAINRFVVGQRIYSANEIVFVMSIKREMSVKGEETSIKLRFNPDDTLMDVYAKLKGEIDRVLTGQDTETDDTAVWLMKMPRLVLKFFMFIVGILEYFGKLPRSLMEASPFHGSLIVTDLGSIGVVNPVYHHIYNFGTLPIFIAFGAKRKAYELQADGTTVQKRYIDYKIATDERICDGFYYASALKCMKRYLSHPELLEEKPDQILPDPDL